MHWLQSSNLAFFFSTNLYLVVSEATSGAGHQLYIYFSWEDLYALCRATEPLPACRRPVVRHVFAIVWEVLAIRRALKAAPSCILAKLLSGRRNSSLLAGCHRLRRAAPSCSSSCSSSPLLGASPCPARVQSLAALLQGQYLLGCRTGPPECSKALCKAGTPGSALLRQPHTLP